MSNAIIFDWDGTVVSCNEKIDLVINKLCQTYPEIAEKYQSAISTNKQSHGWVRKGFIASLSEDYFTYRFGIAADIIAETQNFTTDTAWLIILKTFKLSYFETRAKILTDQKKLRELSNYATLYVVSNSSTDNILTEAKILGFERSILLFIGDAKKYSVERSNPSIIGIPLTRPRYQETLSMIQAKHKKLIVIGDNFSLDLITPISMGIRVAYIPNYLSPKNIGQYIKDNQILSGNINDILDILIQEMKGGIK